MLTPAERQDCIDRIRRLPDLLETLVAPLTPAQLTAVTLVGEWTVAQNVHHLADSHMNAYIRVRLILTEDRPPLKPYKQDNWAALPDASSADLQDSLLLLRGLHARWTALFESLSEAQWMRRGIHAENGEVTVESILSSYANHGEAHLDQIQRTLAAGSR